MLSESGSLKPSYLKAGVMQALAHQEPSITTSVRPEETEGPYEHDVHEPAHGTGPEYDADEEFFDCSEEYTDENIENVLSAESSVLFFVWFRAFNSIWDTAELVRILSSHPLIGHEPLGVDLIPITAQLQQMNPIYFSSSQGLYYFIRRLRRPRSGRRQWRRRWRWRWQGTATASNCLRPWPRAFRSKMRTWNSHFSKSAHTRKIARDNEGSLPTAF